MTRRSLSRFSMYAAIGLLAISAIKIAPSLAAEDAVIIPPPVVDLQNASGLQTVVVAGGCFWGVQGVFQHTAGIVNAVSGYSGGSKTTADYSTVSTGTITTSTTYTGTATGPGLRFSSDSMSLKLCLIPSPATSKLFNYSRQCPGHPTSASPYFVL